MKKLFIWAVILVALTACSDIQPIVEQTQPAEKQKTILLTATVRAGAPATKVLTEDTDRISARWAVDEKIALIYKEDGTEKKVIAKVKSVDEQGVATITAEIGEITPPSGETETTLIYPASAVNEYPYSSSPKYRVKDNLLQSQNGTLTGISTYLDVRTGAATMVIDPTAGTATFKGGDVHLANQNSIFKFTLRKPDGSTALETNPLVITIDAKDYTITPAEATDVMYVVLPPIEGKAVSFKATSSDVKYYFSKEAVTFEASKYYESTLTMSDDFGLLPGKFTVSGGGKRVQFSKGNLQWFYGGNAHKVSESSSYVSPSSQDQYHYNGGVFTFADHQWDICAGNNDGNERGSSQIYSSINNYGANNKIDIFMYATSGYKSTRNFGDNKTYHYKPFAIYRGSGYETIQDPSSLNFGPIGGISSDSKCDWGVFNAILNGGDETGMWRTLTFEEWTYLLNTREGASAKVGVGIVNGCYGMILLPDTWSLPAGLPFTPISSVDGNTDVSVTTSNKALNYNWLGNAYTSTQWALMEAAGAVFLPAAGAKDMDTQGSVIGDNDTANEGYVVSYWTASTSADGGSTMDMRYAYALDLGQGSTTTKNWRFDKSSRAFGRAVRLVRNVTN